MTYSMAIEKNDYARIDKLNALTDPATFNADVRKLTRNVHSDHVIHRWECLADYRYAELTATVNFCGMSRKRWIDGCLVEATGWIYPNELRIGVTGWNAGNTCVSRPDWEKSIVVKDDDAVRAWDNLASVAHAMIWGNLGGERRPARI